MALPHAVEARLYYQAAKQRLEDARFLLADGRTTGSIYMAGYCIECILKAMILSGVPGAKRQEIVGSFRGAKGHDYTWLRQQYFENGGPPFPKTITKAFLFVNTWTVEIRYKPGMAKYVDAKTFLDATEEIMTFADGRM